LKAGKDINLGHYKVLITFNIKDIPLTPFTTAKPAHKGEIVSTPFVTETMN